MSPSHSKVLRTKIRLAEPRLLEVSDRFWRHPQLKQMFPEFLFMMHSIIRSSVSLLNAAAQSAESLAESDPVCRRIAGYYKTHALEEMHHDEWLLEDMTAIGMERSEVLLRLPSLTVASLVGAQYYWALHVHPVSLFGYLAVLEGNPSSLKQLREIRTKNGLPQEGLRTMVKHARLDPHHRDEMYAQIDALPLTQNLSELVAHSAFHTIEHISQALQEILDSRRHRSSFRQKSAASGQPLRRKPVDRDARQAFKLNGLEENGGSGNRSRNVSTNLAGPPAR
jgi:Iron-containing redox enzyme